MYANCDRYIAIIMMIIIITLKAFEKMNIIILIRIFKAINEKINDNDFINDNVGFKFESNVNISLSKRSS